MADITEEQKKKVDSIVEKVKKAQAVFATFSQVSGMQAENNDAPIMMLSKRL